MLKIFNTMTKRLEEFKPLKENEVGFYHCGPTVYWTQHIGNLRGTTAADLIRRSLIYLGYNVKFARNYTDVGHLVSDEDEGEDKMEKGAKREGLTPEEIAKKYTKIFEKDLVALNHLMVDHKTVATEYIQEMIDLVQVLLDKGFAYTTSKAIYFDVSKKEDYYALNRQDPEMNISGAGSGDVSDPDKKDPVDFTLWFFKTGAHKEALQTWQSPFDSPEVENGEGFPGWHIECSAMAGKVLGDTIDLHMGGIEHIPVHHTNEIAQSESATGKKFVNYWLHNEHLTVDDEKMSKSLGNIYSVEEVVEKGYDPLSLRYLFINAHYRSKQNFTWEALKSSETAYLKLKDRVADLKIELGEEAGEIDEQYSKKFISPLEDDFNIPSALSIAWDMMKSDLDNSNKLATILSFDEVFGLKLGEAVKEEVKTPIEVQELLKQRNEARKARDWAKADDIRKKILDEYGLVIEDLGDGQKLRKTR